ncbi:DUF6414 family protein [Salinicoccus sp. CNSTN-B1]
MRKSIFKYNKIVLFDEDAALDILDQNDGGRLQYFEKVTRDAKFDLVSKMTGSSKPIDNIEVALGFFSRLNFEKKIEQQMTNTIKNDFLAKIEDKITDFDLEYIQGYKLNILEKTTTYLKTLSPIIGMIKDIEKFSNTTEMKDINFEKFEETLDDMKAYHEFLANKGNSYKIIRVNPKHMVNDYKLTDLRSMSLNMVGVKIGQATIKEISFESLVNTDDSRVFVNEGNDTDSRIDKISEATKENPSKDDNPPSPEKITNSQVLVERIGEDRKLDVIDLIVAGVK